jgi:hypothetical protein
MLSLASQPQRQQITRSKHEDGGESKERMHFDARRGRKMKTRAETSVSTNIQTIATWRVEGIRTLRKPCPSVSASAGLVLLCRNRIFLADSMRLWLLRKNMAKKLSVPKEADVDRLGQKRVVVGRWWLARFEVFRGATKRKKQKTGSCFQQAAWLIKSEFVHTVTAYQEMMSIGSRVLVTYGQAVTPTSFGCCPFIPHPRAVKC